MFKMENELLTSVWNGNGIKKSDEIYFPVMRDLCLLGIEDTLEPDEHCAWILPVWPFRANL